MPSETQEKTQLPYRQSSLTFQSLISLLETAGPDTVIGCDTEGTNIQMDYRTGIGYGTDISFAVGVGNIYMTGYCPIRRPTDNLEIDQVMRLRSALTNYKGWLTFHNAKHDLVALETLGVKYTGKFYCTLIMAHLLNEELPYDKSLNNCVKHYLGDDSKDDKELKVMLAALGQRWELVPTYVMKPYAEHDAVLHLRLFEELYPRVFSEITEKYWEHKQKFIRVINKMESRGIRINVDLCNRMTLFGESAMEDVKEILGLNPASSKDQYELFINQLGLPVLKVSKKTGKPSFDKSVMEQYDEILQLRDDPTAKWVKLFRGWQKAVSSNYKPYVAMLSLDGRLRPHYKLHGTKTGRMSCELPNLQQIPRVGDNEWNGEMKKCFVPNPGFTLYEADYAQLEFRLGTAYAAKYGPENPLIDIFNDPTRDVFTEMSKIENWPRQNIKTRTYLIQFGGGATKMSLVFGVSPREGQLIREKFFQTYPGFQEVMSVAYSLAKRTGKVELWIKRYRHFLYPEDEAHKAFNAVIQGGAADIVNHAMVRLSEKVDSDTECRMLLQVHDSVVFEIKNGLEDKYLPLIKETMEDVTPDFGIKFKVDIHKWGEG